MKINIVQVDLTDISAKKEALLTANASVFIFVLGYFDT